MTEALAHNSRTTNRYDIPVFTPSFVTAEEDSRNMTLLADHKCLVDRLLICRYLSS